MVDTATIDRLDAAYSHAHRAEQARERARAMAPRVSLWEAETVGLSMKGYVRGEYAGSCEWAVLEVGTASVTLPAEHPLAVWAARWYERDKEVVVLRVDHNGARWCGTLSECVTTQDENGDRQVELAFLHDLEQLKHLPLYPNPVLPSAVQIPKVFMLVGKAISIMAAAMQLNLLRSYTLLGFNLPDDILDPESWLSQWRWRDWPMLIHPVNYTEDRSPLRYLGARMDMAYDVMVPICEDIQANIEISRWFPGDPDPWVGAKLTRPGQMILRFVDKSGWFEGTSLFGTLGGGLIRTVLELADGAVEEIRRVVDERPDAPEYEVSRWLGVAPSQPYVLYTTAPGRNMVTSITERYAPPTVGKITVGGQSMPGVNETISAGTKLIFNLFGSFVPGGAGFGSIADDALKPLYENSLLAFQTVDLVLRKRSLGWGHYIEDVDVGSIPAYTMEALMALRALRRASEGVTSIEVNVGDGSPYVIGGEGHGHWHHGDRIAVESVAHPGRVEALVCQKLTLAWDAESAPEYTAELGKWPRRDAVLWLIGLVGKMAQDMQKQGLL